MPQSLDDTFGLTNEPLQCSVRTLDASMSSFLTFPASSQGIQKTGKQLPEPRNNLKCEPCRRTKQACRPAPGEDGFDSEKPCRRCEKAHRECTPRQRKAMPVRGSLIRASNRRLAASVPQPAAEPLNESSNIGQPMPQERLQPSSTGDSSQTVAEGRGDGGASQQESESRAGPLMPRSLDPTTSPSPGSPHNQFSSR